MANILYSNARAKALENNLLGKERLYRMIDADSLKEAVRILYEVNFGEGVSIETFDDFEKLINFEEKKLFDFVKECSFSEDFVKFFLLPNDYHNVEAIVRAKYLKFSEENLYVNEGIYPVEVLKDKIFADDYSIFSDALKEALLTADNLFTTGKATGINVGINFKKALYKELKDYAKISKELLDIFTVKVDCLNISSALRSRDYLYAKQSFIDGGSLTDNDIKCLTEDTFDVITEKYRYSKLKDFILLAINALSKNKPLSLFERLVDDYALSLLEREKYSVEGPKPFILYCYYKKAELKNVRIVLVSIANKISKEEIKERLRRTYE